MRLLSTIGTFFQNGIMVGYKLLVYARQVPLFVRQVVLPYGIFKVHEIRRHKRLAKVLFISGLCPAVTDPALSLPAPESVPGKECIRGLSPFPVSSQMAVKIRDFFTAFALNPLQEL